MTDREILEDALAETVREMLDDAAGGPRASITRIRLDDQDDFDLRFIDEATDGSLLIRKATVWDGEDSSYAVRFWLQGRTYIHPYDQPYHIASVEVTLPDGNKLVSRMGRNWFLTENQRSFMVGCFILLRDMMPGRFPEAEELVEFFKKH